MKYTKLKKINAFTLAEVLITLGIIGVIVAMTLPNLIGNYNKKVAETKLAKMYSILNQAILMSESENGSCKNWDWGDENNHRNSDFMETWWNTYLKNYLPNVMSVKKISTPTANISGNGSYMVFFKDGTALRIEAIPGQYIWVVVYITPHTHFNPTNFTVSDYQKNMISGRDYFSMYIFPNIKCAFDTTYYDNLSRDEQIEHCKDERNIGATCFKLIKDNGWKIPKDYPLKF